MFIMFRLLTVCMILTLSRAVPLNCTLPMHAGLCEYERQMCSNFLRADFQVWNILSAVWRQWKFPPETVLGVDWLLLVCWHRHWMWDTKHSYTTRNWNQMWWVMMYVSHFYYSSPNMRLNLFLFFMLTNYICPCT